MKIILIGFMGTGKSTIGRKLADVLDMNFYDVDREIEILTGMTLTELYKKEGPIRFQSEEKLMLNKLLKKDNLVLATGGTLEVDEAMMNQWRENGFKVIALWLNAEEIFKRVKRRSHRPTLEKENLQEQIELACANRRNVYEKADLFLDTTSIGLDKIIMTIKSIL